MKMHYDEQVDALYLSLDESDASMRPGKSSELKCST